MKRICVFYHMSVDRSKPCDDLPHNVETAETCTTISVLDEIADDILQMQADSKWVRPYNGLRNVDDLLQDLAILQGYTSAGFCMAELDEINVEERPRQ